MKKKKLVKAKPKVKSKVKSLVQKKIKKNFEEAKEGELHSGSKKGPLVTNPKQVLAISFSEARKAKKKRK